MVTGTEGKASFLLDGPQRYQARAFKLAHSFSNPLYFDVDPELSNCFDFPCSSIAVPSSSDPRMCMCSGTFRQPTGAPAQGVDIHFITRFHPLMLDGAAILTERVATRTDANGWVQLQLVRGDNSMYSWRAMRTSNELSPSPTLPPATYRTFFLRSLLQWSCPLRA